MPAKTKVCKYCKAKKPIESMVQINLAWYCDWGHGVDHGKELAAKSRERKAKKQQREDKRRLKTRSQWLKDAQAVFNKYIRLRDESDLCISCQRPPKKKNAGHYRSVGACPELRFEELNVHLQCEHCNSYKSGNAIDYRINLVKKIGLDKVEWLEGPHEAKKYTIEEIKDAILTYKQKIKYIEEKEK